MYESENCTPFMLAKQTVIICKPGTKLSNLPAKRVAPAYIVMDVRFIVMNVHFDIADSKTNHLRKAFEQIVPVTFLRVEEAVLRDAGRRRLCGASSAMRGHWSRQRPTQSSALSTVSTLPRGS